MRAIVLGSAAGGGVPQWNCCCPVCRLAWAGDPRVLPRTQSSVAVSADGTHWLLVNASPDLRQQILDTRDLHPNEGLRHSPIKAVVVTNGDVDHTAGLLTLREHQPFSLHGTRGILDALDENSIFGVLDPQVVTRTPVVLDQPFQLLGDLSVTVFAVSGKGPLWQETRAVQNLHQEATVGVDVVCRGRRLVYVPGCAAVTEDLKARLVGADLLLFDGTLFTDGEMIAANVGTKTGRRMGHVPIDGPGGSLEALAGLDVAHRCYVHINNTNPILVEGSAERAAVEAAGWSVAYDGMTIDL